MLVLERRIGEQIEIQVAGVGTLRFTLLEARGGYAKVGFDGPPSFVIARVEDGVPLVAKPETLARRRNLHKA